jgi:hypothetical protein
MRIHSGEGPDEPPKGWHRLETQFGPLGVRPLNMDVLKLWGDGIIINRVHYRLYGPLYRDGQRWTAYKPGRNYGEDPDFTLLRHDNMSRQGSHAAYRKAVQVIEAAVNAWAPSEREIAGLAIPVIQENLAEQHTKVAKLLREPDTLSRPNWLLRNAEDRLVEFYQDLHRAEAALAPAKHSGG